MVRQAIFLLALICFFVLAACGSPSGSDDTFPPSAQQPTEQLAALPTLTPLAEAVAEDADLEMVLKGETISIGSITVTVSPQSESSILVNRKAVAKLLEENPPSEPFTIMVIESYGQIGRKRSADGILVFQVPLAEAFSLSARFIRAIMTAHSPEASPAELSVITAATHIATMCAPYAEYTSNAERALAPIEGEKVVSEEQYIALTATYCGMIGVAGPTTPQLSPSSGGNGTVIVLNP